MGLLTEISKTIKERPYLVILALLGLIVLALVVPWLIWVANRYFLFGIAESYAEELSAYLPLNKGLLKAISYIAFIIIIPITALVFSLKRKNRLYGLLLFAALSAGYYTILGVVALNFRVNPLTGAPEKCFVLNNGEIELWDYVPGTERRLDPYTGQPCTPVTPEIAAKIDRWERGIRPNRIPDGTMPVMFDGALGTPRVWYSRLPDGRLELFDSDGFHPYTNEPLQPVTPEIAREWQQRHVAVQREIEVEKQRRELLFQQQQQAGNECDRLAGNRYDGFRNPSFPGVPYQLLRTNADSAAAACRNAIEFNPGEMRYRYQLARALQAQSSPIAKQELHLLAQQNYPASFDNLGWVYFNERQVPQALAYFEHGASLGSAEAMVSLAQFLIEGRWVRKDEQKAQVLLKNAAAQGHDEAQEAMKQYEARQRAGAIGGALLGVVLSEILKRN